MNNYSEKIAITTGDPKNYFLAHLEYVLNHTDYASDVIEMVYNKAKEEK